MGWTHPPASMSETEELLKQILAELKKLNSPKIPDYSPPGQSLQPTSTLKPKG